jgi:hypothetical protein
MLPDVGERHGLHFIPGAVVGAAGVSWFSIGIFKQRVAAGPTAFHLSNLSEGFDPEKLSASCCSLHPISLNPVCYAAAARRHAVKATLVEGFEED